MRSTGDGIFALFGATGFALSKLHDFPVLASSSCVLQTRP